jgi:hypothetical protein
LALRIAQPKSSDLPGKHAQALRQPEQILLAPEADEASA